MTDSSDGFASGQDMASEVRDWQQAVTPSLSTVESALLDASLRQVRRHEAKDLLHSIGLKLRGYPTLVQTCTKDSRHNAAVLNAQRFTTEQAEPIRAYKGLQWKLDQFLRERGDPKPLQSLVAAVDEGRLQGEAAHQEIDRVMAGQRSLKGRAKSFLADLDVADVQSQGVASFFRVLGLRRKTNTEEHWQNFGRTLHDFADKRADLAPRLEAADAVTPDLEGDFARHQGLVDRLSYIAVIAKEEMRGYFPEAWETSAVDYSLHGAIKSFEGNVHSPFLGRGPYQAWGFMSRQDWRPKVDFRLDEDDLSFFTPPQQEVLSYLYGLGAGKPNEELLQQAVAYEATQTLDQRLAGAEGAFTTAVGREVMDSLKTAAPCP